MAKKLDWSKAKPKKPAVSLKDEQKQRDGDRAAKWLAVVEQSRGTKRDHRY